MKTHLNTLFVTRENAYLAKDGAAFDVRMDGQSLLRIPLHNLEGIEALGWDIGAGAQLMAACAYFGAFPCLIRSPGFDFSGRVRRPPTDPVNALLSFAYSLLAHDCRSALESVDLDAYPAFLYK